MDCRHIMLVGEDLAAAKPYRDTTGDEALRKAGMECRFASTSIRLFASPDTPILPIPGRGVIIGRIFRNDGRPVGNAASFERWTSELVAHVLNSNWGEYLLLQLSSDGDREFAVLRDPSGGIPCVHSIRNGMGFITSDVSLAIELGLLRRQVDWLAIAHGLHFPYLRTERTAIEGVKELLPGCMLRYGDSGTSVTAAWSPWQFVAQGVRHEDPRAAADSVRSAVSTVVRALADTENRILVQLSGGLDSSIVAACLQGVSARAAFCSLVMPVDGTDERPYARLVTDALGCRLIPIHVGFENVRFDFPTPPSSVVPAIGVLHHVTNTAWEAAASEHGADCLFSGSGGDTVFCYLKTAAPAADAYRERGLGAGAAAVRDLSGLHQCTVWKAGRLALRKLRRQPRTTWKADHTLLDPARLPMAQEAHPWIDPPADALPGDRERIRDLVGTQMYRHTRPPGAARPMCFPLLSQPVMEACLKVPTWMWTSGGRNRAVARGAFAELLPDGILNRRSKGSYTGYLATIYARNKAKIGRFLEEGELCAHGILDRAALARFVASDLAPRDLSFLRTFDLCAAENWLRGQHQLS